MAQAALAHSAYKRAMFATAGPRSIEAEAFERVNAELRRTRSLRQSDYPAFVAALSRNMSLWTILAADVAGNGNSLPLELRASIWKLSAFVRRRTQELLQPYANGDIASLIDINASMIAGLRAAGAKA